MTQPNDCPRHAGYEIENNRKRLDPVMKKLPDNQSVEGRHKCTYCAYEEGYKKGFQGRFAGNPQLLCLDSQRALSAPHQ